MNIQENISSQPKLIDINNLDSSKKARGRPKKTKPTVQTATESEVPVLTEKEKLQQELLRLADYNEDLVTKPINDKLGELIDEMSIAELRARIRQGRKITSKKMDTQVASQVIFLANQVAGNLLDCVDELNESTQKDELLRDTTKDYLAINVLDYVPTELKMMGLYGSHVGSSYYKAKLSNPKPKQKQKTKEAQETKKEDPLVKEESPAKIVKKLEEEIKYHPQDAMLDQLNMVRNKLSQLKNINL